VATIALPTTAAVQASPTPATTITPAPAVRPADGLSLTVLHTNDVYGYIDPCG
jgi:2',3'-cyclic-nucleotide 2'-phosphodiesterase (5'-nucleotidase family)